MIISLFNNALYISWFWKLAYFYELFYEVLINSRLLNTTFTKGYKFIKKFKSLKLANKQKYLINFITDFYAWINLYSFSKVKYISIAKYIEIHSLIIHRFTCKVVVVNLCYSGDICEMLHFCVRKRTWSRQQTNC